MYFITTKRMLEVCFSAHPNIQYRTRINISHNRKGHRAFAVFLLSIFVGKCHRAISGVRCRSPPLHLDFEHFKNSDGRYLQ